MAIAVDGSTPASTSIAAGGTQATCASFSPPANSLLAVFVTSDGFAGIAHSITSVTNTGTALSWVRAVHANGEVGAPGGVAYGSGMYGSGVYAGHTGFTSSSLGGTAEVWVAKNTLSQSGITVTVHYDQDAGGGGVFTPVVFTGCDTVGPGFGATNTSDVTAASLYSQSVTTTRDGSWVWAVGTNFASSTVGTADTGQTVVGSQNATATTTVPGAPTGVAATAGDSAATVTWTPPSSNGGQPVLDYTATASPGGLTGTVAGASSGSVAVSGLTPGTGYTFTVTARNAVGSSVPSSPSGTVTPTTPSTATPIQIEAGGPGVGNWLPDSATSPSFYLVTGAAAQVATTTTAVDLTDPSVTPGTPTAIFQTERFASSNTLGYDIPTAAGQAVVQLYFAENYVPAQAVGGRVMTVTVNGVAVDTDLDVFATVGAFKGLVRTYVVQTLSTLSIRITNPRATNSPHVMAVYVVPPVGSPAPNGGTSGGGTTTPPPSTTAGLRFTAIGAGNMPAATIAAFGTPAVTVSPGANLASVASSAATGALIGLNPGTYALQSISPKTGQKFVGLGAGVILDGQFATAVAFNGGANNVTIANMAIVHYTCGQASGYHLVSGATAQSAININPGAAYGANPPHPATPDSGWVINYCDMNYNRTEGAKLTDGCQMLNSRTNYNGVAGYITSSANILIDNHESAYNNTPASFAVTGNVLSDEGNHSGGGKVTGGPNCVCTHMEVHHNGGNGIWDDAYVSITVTFCYVHDNTRNGIMHEIGFDGTITDNLIVNNGQSFTDTVGAFNQGLNGSGAGEAFDQGAAIYWSNSLGGANQPAGNLIARNVLTGNLNQIVLVQNSSRTPTLGNVIVGGSAANANTITGGSGGQGHSGWEQFGGTTHTGTITFDYNVYKAAGNTISFMWNGSVYSFAAFQGSPALQEAHGSSS